MIDKIRDINRFLKLPDWKKVKLKLYKSKFHSYPIQTEEEAFDRMITMFNICSHFSMIDFDEFVYNLNHDELFDIWPQAMNLFVTPKLLDNAFIFHCISKNAFCYTCEYYNGYSRIPLKSMSSKCQVYPIYGLCRNVDSAMNLNRINPFQRCVAWNPLKFYEQSIDLQIKKFLEYYFSFHYSYHNYKKDMKTINLLLYFQNGY